MIKILKSLLLTILLTLASSSYAQNVFSQNHEIDSLMRKIRAEMKLELYDDALDNIHLCLGKVEVNTLEKNESDSIKCLNAKYLGKIADNFYEKQDYQSCKTIYKEVLDIYRNIGLKNKDYVTDLYALAYYNASFGNYNEAIRLGTEALNIFEKVYGKDHPDYATSLSCLASYNSELGNYGEAIRLETEALNNKEKLFGKAHRDYAQSLNNLASYNSSLGKYAEAIRLETEALNIGEKVYGKEHPDYATCLSNLANYNSSLGNYNEAIRLGTEALNLREKVLGKEHPDYAISLYNLANYNSSLGNYNEAIRLGTEALNTREKIYGKKHPDYAQSLNSLATYNLSLGNYGEAIRLITEAIIIREKVYGKEHPAYATSLSNLSTYNAFLGNYGEAIQLENEARNIFEKIYGKEHPDYAQSLNNLAGYNSSLGNYGEAIRLGTEALNIREKIYGKKHPDYAQSLNNLATYNSHIGNYAEAIRLETEALNIREQIFGKDHSDYANSLNNLAFLNSSLGNYGEAIRLGTEALNIDEKVYGKEHTAYAINLSNIASYNSSLGNYNEAIQLETETLNIREKVYGKEHPEYAQSLNNLALYNSYLGNYAEAIRLGTEALNIDEKEYGKEHPDYATILGNLAIYNSNSGNYAEAMHLEQEALNIREKIYGKEHPDYAISLSNLSSYNLKLKNYNEFIKEISEVCQISKNYLLKNFQGLSSAEKVTYWNKESFIFESYVPKQINVINSRKLYSLFFDNLLFSKGLLLNSGIETEKIIIESGDTSLIAKYNDMKTNMMILNKFYEKPIAERFMNADSLANVINMQNMEIASKSKAYGDIRKNLEITWHDVQKHLSADDIAIEMASFPLNEDSTMYIALTLKKGYDCPKLITLFEEKQLKNITGSDKYKGSGVYDLVWKPLADELKGVKNVYFAPTGELYNINIEALPSIADPSDDRNYYRLSSTRQLAYIKDDKKAEGASVYGGLQYNTDIKTIEQNSKQYGGSKTRSWDETLLSTDSIRGSMQWQYLPGTLTEAKDVSTTMKNASMPTYLFTDTIGTEASFKALDGKGRKIIHISTHGFYYTDTDSTKMHKAGLDFMHFDNEHQQRYVEDKSLTRSGLLFSGCTTRLMGGKVPEGVDDGILFAKEISNLDLRGLDLVTLSACETGLGDISGEGVFGLQRAFKKAGAQSILMSLWKVDDNATCLLMTRFYDNYLSKHMSKSESLKDAQHYVRTYENGRYNDPKYWAAFIILDAI